MAEAAKVSSREFYAAMRAALAPAMKANGFSQVKGGRLGWQRQGDRGRLSVWFQCNKWGWDALWGSTFTVDFELAGRSQSIGYLLEGFPALEELRTRNNAVIARLPGTARGHAPTDIHHAIDPERAVYGRDLWLAYHDIHDVHEWARFFVGNLPGFVAIFEAGTLSAEGMARARSNAAMGRMQAERDLAAKAAILEDYVKVETDAYFRAAGQKWLDELRSRLAAR